MKKKEKCSCKKSSKKKVVKHLKKDIKGFKNEIAEDKNLVKQLQSKKKKKKKR